MNNINIIKFKPEVRKQDLFEVSPVTLMIFSALCVYAKQNCLPILITSIKSDIVTGRVSTSHADYRAIDVSARGWARHQCKFIEDKLNATFVNEGAIGASSGLVRACVYHNASSGFHFHLQSRKDYF